MDKRIRNLVGHAMTSRESLFLEIGLGVIGSLHMPTSTDHALAFTDALDRAATPLASLVTRHP